MDLKNIIFTSPIYTKWKNDFEYENEYGNPSQSTIDYRISSFDERVELYCVECQDKRIFAPDRGIYDVARKANSLYPSTTIKDQPSLFKTFRCSADEKHIQLFGFHIDKDMIIKISEYPSKYDTVQDGFNKYKKILKKEKLKELAKASQLESYGYPIASLLYYRRIFEDIILKTFTDSPIEEKITEEEFRKKRMEDKTSYVKEFLPDYFNENSHMYGILSKGVHELEEKECQDFLPVIKAILIFSLDEAVEKREKELRKEELKKRLTEAQQKHK